VLEGFNTKSKHAATKQTLFEKLPPVLIVHLKRFIYDSVGGTLKSHKHISYKSILEFDPRVMSNRKAVYYDLVAGLLVN
jgi:ubiquitin C-terminal hydrolase